MKRIILSLIAITGVVSALAVGGTGAFFSDTETSAANVFTAGAIDLKVDNTSYYNGVASPGTSWEQKDLTIEKFFNFLDLKPDDYGEDTISLHVDTNDAYLCANITLTSNNENGQTEPEALVDQTAGATQGELAGLVNFMWWADDGDNVLEDNERVISQGPIGALPLNQPYYLRLADTNQNIWSGQAGPLPGNTTKYIGKAWCFGTLAPLALPQDNSGVLRSPAGDNNANSIVGQPEDGGYSCNGTALGNESQTDTLTADVSFETMQARNNPNFVCKGNCKISEVQTLIPNSGFETPIVTSPALWDYFDSPASVWNVAWRDDVPATYLTQTRPETAHLEIHLGVLGTPSELEQYAELDTDWGGPAGSGDGEPASVSIYQDVPTIIGKTYRIRFAFAPRPNTDASDNRLEVRWGGNAVHDTGNVGDPNGGIEWQQISVDVVATTTLTRLAFTDLGIANSLGTFVDDIRLYSEVCE